MTDKEKVIKELKEALDSLDITNKYRLNLIRTIEYIQEEPVSDGLEKAANEWLSSQLDKYYAVYGETKQMELTRFDGYAMLDAIEFSAKWQKEKDTHLIWKMFSANYKNEKEIITKACKYLQEHKEEVETEDNGIAGWISDEFIENFRKNMEE